MLDEIDRKLIDHSMLTKLTEKPFGDIAAKTGLTQDEVLCRLKNLLQSGAIRRFGAKIRPHDIGFRANAMVAWKVPRDRVQEVGAFFSGSKEVTHCYERETVPGKWEYNIYTVLHSENRGHIESLVNELSKNLRTPEYLILFSKTNLKTRMQSPERTKNSMETE